MRERERERGNVGGKFERRKKKKKKKALGEWERKGRGERAKESGIDRGGKRMARWWRVWYGGVGGEDEAGMSIDSGCMRLKPPFVAATTTTATRGYYSPLLLETVNPQSCRSTLPSSTPRVV